MVRRYFDTFVEQSLILTDELEEVALNGNEIIFYEHILQCTLYIALGKIKYFYFFIKYLHIVKNIKFYIIIEYL